MADILVSYTSGDRDWAFWIGHELGALGHKARIQSGKSRVAAISRLGWKPADAFGRRSLCTIRSRPAARIAPTNRAPLHDGMAEVRHFPRLTSA
jgi:hypothetical protein